MQQNGFKVQRHRISEKINKHIPWYFRRHHFWRDTVPYPAYLKKMISLGSLSKVTAKLYDYSCECQKLIQVQNRLLGLVSREFIKKRRWSRCHFHFRLISVYATLRPKDRQYLWKLKHICALELLLFDIIKIEGCLKVVLFITQYVLLHKVKTYCSWRRRHPKFALILRVRIKRFCRVFRRFVTSRLKNIIDHVSTALNAEV